ncbi:rubrerythrin-like domain-containing protein [Natrialbaceae archaeon A-CW3]
MIDAPYDPTTESTYECLECGRTETSVSNPGTCPNCEVAYRNTAMPIE